MSFSISPYKVFGLNNNFIGIVYAYSFENAFKYAREVFGSKFGYVQQK
jgi:hypothetical protein